MNELTDTCKALGRCWAHSESSVNVSSYSRMLAVTRVQGDGGERNNMFKYEFFLSLPLPNPFSVDFTALLGAQTKILSPTGDKVSILLLKCLASPFPPHLHTPPLLSSAPDLAHASSSSQLVWGFSSLTFPLLPFVYSHSKYFPPSPALMMTHTCSRTLSGSPLPQKNLPS